MAHGYDEVNFATVVTGLATIQMWPGMIASVSADRTFRISGLTLSGTSGNTVQLISQGPFGTVTIDSVQVGAEPLARGYSDASDVIVIGGAQFLVASVVGTIRISAIGRFEVGRQGNQ